MRGECPTFILPLTNLYNIISSENSNKTKARYKIYYIESVMVWGEE